jgi:predicted HicB family RNase H-like nuclease
MNKRANLNAALHDAGAVAKPAQAVAAAVQSEPRPALASVTATVRPPSREGQRAVTLYVKPEAHKQLRLLGVEQGVSVQELMTEALNALFKKHGKSLIA